MTVLAEMLMQENITWGPRQDSREWIDLGLVWETEKKHKVAVKFVSSVTEALWTTEPTNSAFLGEQQNIYI